MKKLYIEPEMLLVKLSSYDIILTSGVGGGTEIKSIEDSLDEFYE